jgi:hypothetical protein
MIDKDITFVENVPQYIATLVEGMHDTGNIARSTQQVLPGKARRELEPLVRYIRPE